jgi:hypothetical protein
LETWRGASFLGLSYLEEFYGVLRDIQIPCKRVSLSLGALLGKLEGIRWRGIFERKEKYNWVPFLDPEDIKILSLGASGTLVKEEAFPWLILGYGAQRACP